MARSRFPAPWAIVQLLLRSISVLIAVATFVVAIYASARYGYGRAMSGAFVAAVWIILVDVPEVAGLLDSKRRARRCTEGYLAFLSFLTIFICGIVPIAAILTVTGFRHECGGRPDRVCEEEEMLRSQASLCVFLAWLMPVVVAALHFFFFIFSCVGYCKRR